jgi:hypothetical protein
MGRGIEVVGNYAIVLMQLRHFIFSVVGLTAGQRRIHN